MNEHFTKQQWLNYINDQVSDTDRLEYEDHLYTCEQCLETYTQSIEDQTLNLPVIEDEPQFTKQVMESIQPNKTKQHFIHKPFFQYVVAASITLILMSSGVFERIAMQQDHHRLDESQQRTAISEHLTHKVSDFLNEIPTNLRGGQENE
ncbi:hypothetical protein [Chengkuizengella axinellae]|uniref:Zinc-finger domain-containing protein n=1 Tax=Chengkuizengella axinellae TaxID=3064388 RepID=A0ABT9J2W7_9BACL|nr:hypothetical protein [Chengkuizengella sp. 2205SS18-9]MDP5275339.1 hypothetical protein [Chengkuizengella sp. 2205SS18-9]